MRKNLSVFLLVLAFSAALFISCSNTTSRSESSSGGDVNNSGGDDFTNNTSENITLIVDGKEYKYYSNSYYSLSYYGSRLGKKGYKITWTDTSGNPIPEETIPSDSNTQYKYYGTSVPISYTVHFDATGCTGTAPTDIACTFDVEFTMPKNELTVTGKKAFGWYTKSDYTLTDYGEKYKDGEKVENLTTEDGSVVTLYPFFVDESELCTITFVTDNEYGIVPEPAKVLKGTYLVTKDYNTSFFNEYFEYYIIPDVTVDAIYSLSDNSDKSYTARPTWKCGEQKLDRYTNVQITEDTTVTAEWNLFKVTIESEHGTSPQKELLIYNFIDIGGPNCNLSYAYNLSTPAEDGWIFTGWSYKTKGATTSYELIATYSVIINEATTFTANWVQGGSFKFNVTLPTTSEDDIQLDYTSSTNLLTASLTGFSGTYNWYINDNTTTASTGSTFSLLTNYSKLSSGINSIMVTATNGSKTYSATVLVKRN